MASGIVTFTGLVFDIESLNSEAVRIEDIAHALALCNRYGGHTWYPYSVAQHCVLASECGIGDPLSNLLHDADEAYVGDITYPQKKLLQLVGGESFRSMEDRVMRVIYEALGLARYPVAGTKPADRAMLAAEVRALMPTKYHLFSDYIRGAAPAEVEIVEWSWRVAEKRFMDRYRALTHAYTQNNEA